MAPQRLERNCLWLWIEGRVVGGDINGFVAHVWGLVSCNQIVDILPLVIEVFLNPVKFLEHSWMDTGLVLVYTMLKCVIFVSFGFWSNAYSLAAAAVDENGEGIQVLFDVMTHTLDQCVIFTLLAQTSF